MSNTADKGKWTKTPNEILEVLSHFECEADKVSIVEIKLTLCLVRQTFGWQRNQVRLTWEDIARLTSIKGRASIGKAIEAVEKRGFFVHGRKSLWEINSSKFELFLPVVNSDITPRELDYCSKIELSVDENSSNNELFEEDENQDSSEFELDESSNFEPFPFKEKKEEEKERESPLTPQTAVQIWERVTGNWPGEIRTGIIAEGMGSSPDEEALRRAYRLWIGRGYSPINIDGILEWYQLCRASPTWQPNGKHPKGKEPKAAVAQFEADPVTGRY